MRFFPFPKKAKNFTEKGIVSFNPGDDYNILKGRIAATDFDSFTTYYGINLTWYLIWLAACLVPYTLLVMFTNISLHWGWLSLFIHVMAVIIFTVMVIRHERGHQHGISAKGCEGKHLWCVCAEESLIGGSDRSYWDKLKLLIHQIKGMGRYCGSCKSYMEEFSDMHDI